jgi:uncharacterized membrane protein
VVAIELGALVGLLLGLSWGSPEFLSGLIGVLIGAGVGLLGVALAARYRSEHHAR